MPKVLNQSIAGVYQVDPMELAIRGYGKAFDYIIHLRDLEMFLVADKNGRLSVSDASLLFHCCRGRRVEPQTLPPRLRTRLGV